MKLIDLLVQELPKRGGWPEGGCSAIYDAVYEGVLFTSGGAPAFISEASGWTVAALGNGATWMLGKGVPIRYLPQDWHESIITREQYEAALAASRQPAWNGEGLPPVGCECLSLFDTEDDEWLRSRIIAHDEGNVIGRWIEGGKSGLLFEYPAKHEDYRPLRTEAESKRDEAKNVIAELCRSSASNGHSAELIYDAIASGKIPHITLK